MNINELKRSITLQVFKENPTPTFPDGIVGAARRAEFMGQRLTVVNRIANELIAKYNPTEDQIEQEIKPLIIGLSTEPFKG